MKFEAVTFANGKTAALAACMIGIPAGFSTRGDLKKSFTAWLPAADAPRDPEVSSFVIASSLYEPYAKGSMDGITERSIGRYTELLAAASENTEEDADATQRSFSFGAVSGTYNIVRFSGSRNYYPTVFLPGGTQQFHIRVNDPTIPEEKILSFLQQWMETVQPARTWEESLPLDDGRFTQGTLTAESIASFRANMEQRMHEEAVCFQLGFRIVQEEIRRAERTGSPDGDTILDELKTIREDYAKALDEVIRESSSCIQETSRNNPDNELLFSLVQTIRDVNPLEQVTQTINGEEYAAPVSLASKKAELFSSPEIRKMEEARREEEEKAAAAREKQLEKQRVQIRDKIAELNREKNALNDQKERQAEGLKKKKEEFYTGLPDRDAISKKLEEANGVVTSLTAQMERLSFLQRKKKRELEKQLADQQQAYSDCKDSLLAAKKAWADRDRQWEEVVTLEKGKTNEIDARIAELDAQLSAQEEELERLN